MSPPQKAGKWLSGVSPDDPLSTAARIAIATRLECVASFAPWAAFNADEDPEYVHQLRVATRRAAAALAAFAPCLPPRRTRKLGRRLRQVRRAAGGARDWDVLILRLEGSPRALEEREMDAVLCELAKRRKAAQPPLVTFAKKFPTKRLEKKFSRVVKRIRWRGDAAEPTVFQTGHRHVQDVAEEFRAAAHAAAGDLSIDALHQLRIAGKRLRYTIELFACVADGALRRDIYPLVEDLQERLGAMNDHATAERYFRECGRDATHPALKGSFHRLANLELQAVEQSVEAFRGWWSASRLIEIYSGASEAFPPPTAA